jgi:hypothetical protein
MCVDHRRSHLAVPEQRPHRADVLAYLQLVSATTWPQASVVEPLGMAEAVAAGRFGDAGGQHGSAHRLLDQGGIQVVTALLPGLGITPAVVLREHPLPAPFPGGIRDFPRKGMGQLHPAPACRPIALMDLSHLPELVLEPGPIRSLSP